ncbi:SDR family oxidoreductase [Lysinibacillus boronitolerans]|nr:SDR family oxidoreductase [Lysinibacillus boronitolerans]
MKKKTVLLTGASEGIGLELAKIFAAKGDRLILIARNHMKLNEVFRNLNQLTEVIIIEKDLSEIGAAKEIYDEIKSKGEQIDILVNNAGMGLQGYFYQMSEQEQLRMIQLNIMTLTELTHLCIQDMLNSGYGRVMNIASISSFVATPSMAVYGATKAYVLSFSEALNIELQNKGDFLVTTICPGPTKTNFSKNNNMNKLDQIANIVGTQPDKVAKIAYKTLIKKKIINIPGKRYKATILSTKLLPRYMVQFFIGKLMLRK